MTAASRNKTAASGACALRLPLSLKQAAQDVARRDGATLNQFIVSAVAEKLASLETADYFEQRARRGDPAAALRFLARAGGRRPDSDDEITGLPED